ncbi:MAG: alpha/beta fold hydrolase [Acidimicrobiales bacterium]
MAEPRPFPIDIPQSELDELRARLRNTRWPADPGNPDGRYGATADWVGGLVRYWAEQYDWRAVEARMNAYDHQLVELDGIPLHFLRIPGKGPNPMPLILTHGWPWTFWDLHKVIDPLADPAAHGGDAADSFDVIVPSLPGYGFSVPLRTTGVDVARVAELWVRLMRDVLGYDRFGAQGGDWGAFITGRLGHAHAEHLIGVYLTMPVIPGMLGKVRPEQFAADEQWMLARADEARRMTEAHVAVHRRDPQTFAYAMADSPPGSAPTCGTAARSGATVRRSRCSAPRTCARWRRSTGSTRRSPRRSASTPRSSPNPSAWPTIARRSSRRPPATACSPRTCCSCPGRWPRRRPTCGAGACSTAAATSPRPNGPTWWCRSCASSSGRCADGR